jgi:hypothetical protein
VCARAAFGRRSGGVPERSGGVGDRHADVGRASAEPGAEPRRSGADRVADSLAALAALVAGCMADRALGGECALQLPGAAETPGQTPRPDGGVFVETARRGV